MKNTKQTSKHTAGEWHIGKLYADMAYISSNGLTICTMKSGHSCSSEKYISKEEREANARLIASAPDLLLALERILTKTFRDEHDPDIYRLAIEAIAKAKGE